MDALNQINFKELQSLKDEKDESMLKKACQEKNAYKDDKGEKDKVNIY